jgi:hypothetical protein
MLGILVRGALAAAMTRFAVVLVRKLTLVVHVMVIARLVILLALANAVRRLRAAVLVVHTVFHIQRREAAVCVAVPVLLLEHIHAFAAVMVPPCQIVIAALHQIQWDATMVAALTLGITTVMVRAASAVALAR